MSMIPILVRREFTSRVKGTAYIITTILGVLVFVGLSFLPSLIDRFSASMTPKQIDLMVFEQPGEASILPYLEEVGATREGFTVRSEADLDEREAYQMVLEKGLSGLLLVDGPLYTLVTADASNMVLNNEVESILNAAVNRYNAVRLGLSPADVASLFSRVNLRVREISPLGEDGEEIDEAAHAQAMVLAYFLLFMIYMALIMYGNMVASGVAEEKSSRIMEVMVSTVKPIDLMLGKIIGVGSLGLLQFFIWIGAGLVMNTLGNSGMFGSIFGLSAIPLHTVLWFGLYFVLGYFFYASIFAAAGALVSRVEEVSQVVTIIMMLIIVGFFGAYISFLNPNSVFAVVTSLIPFTSPMVMFSRIVLGSPALFEIIISVLILLVSVLVGAWISAKIYRIGILMYGKRPSLREVLLLLKD